MADTWWRSEKGVLSMIVRVQPNARRNEVTGAIDGALRVKLAAPPVDGRANEELRRYLGEVLGVRRSAVRVRVGATSRTKVVRVIGLDAPPRSLLQVADR